MRRTLKSKLLYDRYSYKATDQFARACWFSHLASCAEPAIRTECRRSRIVVAVGTTIAGRSRTDPYVRVYAYGSYRG